MDTRLGCLILHGLSSSLDTVNILGLVMERYAIPYRMPVLRGHGATPEALQGVGYQDWYADASAALDDLLRQTEYAVVAGLSMGGVVALNCALERQIGRGKVCAVCTIACALRLKDPLAIFAGLLAPLVPWTDLNATHAYYHKELAAGSTNYPKIPLSAVAALVRYGQLIERRLPEIHIPALIIGTRHDKVAAPASSRIIYERIATPPDKKTLYWFDRSGHEMLQDQEREQVADLIGRWVVAQRDRLAEQKNTNGV